PSARSVRPPRKESSTAERRNRAMIVQQKGLEMSFRCQRCENVRPSSSTSSGRCAGCIAVKAECSLFVSEEDWERVAAEKQEKRLVLARLEAVSAQAAAATVQARLELAEVEHREMEFARRDLKVLDVQDQASEASGSSTLPTTFETPLADPSYSQAPNLFPDPSFV
ncbi:hypothetical protein CC86DRAFT_283786, partial [Ophiobolus disseminans]